MVPLVDSRRALRLRLRAPAVLAYGSARRALTVEDLGVDGCRFASPFPLRRGEAVYLVILLPSPAGDLRTPATIAWTSPGAPFRAGVSFPRTGRDARVRALRMLAEQDPSLARAPGPLRPGAPLRLVRPPAPGELLGRDELAVLRAARDGLTAADLLAAAGARHREVRSALATLLARGAVTAGWTRVPPSPWSDASDALQGDATIATPIPLPLPAPLGIPRTRPLRAQAWLEAARAEGAHGHPKAAVEWLQAALAASPDDPELSDALQAITGPPPVALDDRSR